MNVRLEPSDVAGLADLADEAVSRVTADRRPSGHQHRTAWVVWMPGEDSPRVVSCRPSGATMGTRKDGVPGRVPSTDVYLWRVRWSRDPDGTEVIRVQPTCPLFARDTAPGTVFAAAVKASAAGRGVKVVYLLDPGKDARTAGHPV